MSSQAALEFVDVLILEATGQPLSDLQATIIQAVWQGHTYSHMAQTYGCTEGHAKDVGAELWQILSQALGRKITKTNLRVALEQMLAKGSSESKRIPSGSKSIDAPSAYFVGRSAALQALDNLVALGTKVIVIQGEGGLGKTTLAQHYLRSCQVDIILELLMAKEPEYLLPAELIVEEWLQRDLQEDPGQDFGISLARLKRHLRQQRVGILIDNLEPALDRYGCFLPDHKRYVEVLRILADPEVQSLTLITSRDRLCEPDLQLEHYRLTGLDPDAWQQFFELRQIPIDSETLHQIQRSYRGNAKAMGIVCGTIRTDFDRDAAAYWQAHQHHWLEEMDLKNLVASQLDRLEKLDPQAYRLLGRMSCYRYQDLATVPTAALIQLLWDVDPEDHQRTIESLRNRSLIETSKGSIREYSLHPLIQIEAMRRLKASGEWQICHHRAAEFWTESVITIETVADALQALEAYYHYAAIQAFEKAGQILLKSRRNRWQQFLPLGSNLYRLGLLQPVLNVIPQVLAHTGSNPNLIELNNILGDLYWITGQLQPAIECQNHVITRVDQVFHSRSLNPDSTVQDLEPSDPRQHYYLTLLKLDALLSLGLYHLDLAEPLLAYQYFDHVIQLAAGSHHYRWAEKAWVGLGLAAAQLGRRSEAEAAATRIWALVQSEQSPDYTGRFAYFIQLLGQTYTYLGEQYRALQLYHKAIEFAIQSHYIQVEAKALSGIAQIYRDQGAIEAALRYHAAAIEKLDPIAAKCDLAEAYVQLGKTYEAMGSVDQAQASFQQALTLFTEIKAPKQIEKVQLRRFD